MSERKDSGVVGTVGELSNPGIMRTPAGAAPGEGENEPSYDAALAIIREEYGLPTPVRFGPPHPRTMREFWELVHGGQITEEDLQRLNREAREGRLRRAQADEGSCFAADAKETLGEWCFTVEEVERFWNVNLERHREALKLVPHTLQRLEALRRTGKPMILAPILPMTIKDLVETVQDRSRQKLMPRPIRFEINWEWLTKVPAFHQQTPQLGWIYVSAGQWADLFRMTFNEQLQYLEERGLGGSSAIPTASAVVQILILAFGLRGHQLFPGTCIRTADKVGGSTQVMVCDHGPGIIRFGKAENHLSYTNVGMMIQVPPTGSSSGKGNGRAEG